MKTREEELLDVYAQIDALREIVEDSYPNNYLTYAQELLLLLEYYGWSVSFNYDDALSSGGAASNIIDGFEVTLKTDILKGKLVVVVKDDSKMYNKKQYIMNIVEEI